MSGVEAVRLRKDGRPIDVSVSAALVHDIAGRPTGYLTMIADITESKRVEKQQNVIAQITVLLSEAQSVEEAIPQVIETICDSFGFVYGARWVLDKQNLLLRCAETWSLPRRQLDAFREQSQGAPRASRQSRGARRAASGRAPRRCGSATSRATRRSARPRRGARRRGCSSAFAFPIMVGGEFYGADGIFRARGAAARRQR